MAESGTEAPQTTGTVLQCGATDYYAVGRTKDVRPEYPSLAVPHKLKALENVKIAFIATGSAASHSVAGDTDGRVYVWGRNEKGQLGLGDTHNRPNPTLLTSGVLSDLKVIGASCGRHHTVLFTSDGQSFAMGLNSMGQCGTGVVNKKPGRPSKKDSTEDMLLTPTKCQVTGVTAVSCGAEFTMWLCNGKLWSAGLPQYGQLGHGTDNQYNAADSSVKMVFDPQPTPKLIATLADKTVTRVACGHNHTICVVSDGGVWTWGFGGYGRLGHKVQQDEMKPRLVETLSGRIQVPADAVIGAGGTSSFCTMLGGQIFAWGKLKNSGDNFMYPTAFLDLAGWNLKSFSCGATTFGAIATSGSEKSVITWGQSNGYNELGYGEGGKKSSANPDKLMALEGVEGYLVAMGVAHSLFLMDSESEVVKKAPVWAAEKDVDEHGDAGGSAKRKGGVAAGGKGKKGKQ